jgi:hypothetical protein
VPSGVPSPKPTQWRAQMQRMQAQLEPLLVAASQEGEFGVGPSKEVALASLEKLQEEARSLSRGWGAPDLDPSIRWISKTFEFEIQGALNAIRSGGGSYARSLVRSLPGYCVACHSRGPWGAAFPEAVLPSGLKGLSLEEQGNYWAATRRFDQALQAYESAALEPTLGHLRERPLRAALALSLRIHQDPDRAIGILDRFEKSLPPEQKLEFLFEQIKAWRSALAQWREDRTLYPAKPSESPKAVLAQVKLLLDRAQKQQAFKADRRGEVWTLLATARIHAALAGGVAGQPAAELLKAAGDAYGSLRGLWSPPALYEFQGYYYLGCILQVPHTALARTCFRSYEEGVRLGYTGSGGTALPEDVKSHLESLRELTLTPSQKKPH